MTTPVKVDQSSPIGKVVRELDRVRAPLPRADGIRIFADVYRDVTALVAVRVADGTFGDPKFMEAFDVTFADLFLDVPRDIAAGREASKVWAPLVECRSERLFPLQFALAGMNAHINHDLAIAVVRTCQKLSRSPDSGSVHGDFVKINQVLAERVRPIRQKFLDETVVKYGAPLSPLADLMTNFSMEKARDAAWASTLALWAVRDIPVVKELTQESLAGTVGLVGRQLLTRFDPLGQLGR